MTEEIKKLRDEMYELRNDDYCYHRFKAIVQKMDDYSKELYDSSKGLPENNYYLQATIMISRALRTEVEFIKSHQDKMHKKNAPKIRATEYYAAIKNAIAAVEKGLVFIL